MKVYKMSQEEINKDIDNLKKLLENADRIGKNIKKELEKMGYEYAILGTSPVYAIRSKEIKIMKINSNKYLNGTFIVLGIYSLGNNGHNVYYRGYVKRIA